MRVPTIDEERERALSRQRHPLVTERKRIAAMGRSLLAMHNIHVKGKWWKVRTWTAMKLAALDWVIERFKVYILIIGPLAAQETKLTAAIQGRADTENSEGSGRAALEVSRRELGDSELLTLWN